MVRRLRAEERLQRRARHRGDRHPRREGIRRYRRLPSGCRARPLPGRVCTINSFTETVIATRQRGVIKRWPPRGGAGQAAVTYRDELQSDPWRHRLLRGAARARAERTATSRASATAPSPRKTWSTSARIRTSSSRPRTSRASRIRPARSRSSTRASSAFSVRRAPCRSTPRSTPIAGRCGRDPSFARFTDIFSNRFLQLFFRAWADARPIAHHDRPADDRFADYVGSFAGIGVGEPQAGATAWTTSPSCRSPAWSIAASQERLAAERS